MFSHLVLQQKVKVDSGHKPLTVEIDIAAVRLQTVSQAAGSDFVLARVAEEDKPPRAGRASAGPTGEGWRSRQRRASSGANAAGSHSMTLMLRLTPPKNMTML